MKIFLEYYRTRVFYTLFSMCLVANLFTPHKSYAEIVTVSSPTVIVGGSYIYRATYSVLDEAGDDTRPFCQSYGFAEPCYLGDGHVHMDYSYLAHDLWNNTGGLIQTTIGSQSGMHTVKEVMDYLRSKGNNIQSYHSLSFGRLPDECIGIVVADSTAIGKPQFKGFKFLRGHTCATLPPDGLQCDITSNSLEIDHGSISKEQFEGHEASVDLTLNCNKSTKIGFATSPEGGVIALSGTTNTELNINGKPISQSRNFDVITGDNIFKVTSKLHGDPGSKGGLLTGNIILVTEYN